MHAKNLNIASATLKTTYQGAKEKETPVLHPYQCQVALFSKTQAAQLKINTNATE